MKLLSKFERFHNKQNESLSSMYKVFIATFLNTGVVILVVNFDAGITIPYFPAL
jgi:hypothetical protein